MPPSHPPAAPDRALLAALAQMEEGVIVVDARGTIVFVNRAAARMHGVETIGVEVDRYAEAFNLRTLSGEPYPSAELPLARAVLHGETVIDARWRIRRPDGAEIVAVGSAHPMLSDDGIRIGAVLTLRDDSARGKSARLEQERNALARQLEDAFVQSPRSTVVYDATGRPLAVNRAFETLWGASLGDVPAGYSVLADPQLEAAGAMPALLRVFGLDGTRTHEGAGAPVTFPPLRYEMADATGKGRTLWTEAQAYPVRGATGAIERVVLTHEDVTARRAADIARERTIGLQALTAALSQASITADVAQAIVTHASAILVAAGIVVASAAADGEHLELLCASHMPEDLRDAWQCFPLSARVPLADVARSGEPIFIESRNDVTKLYPHLTEAFEAAGHYANVVLPLSSNGRMHGVMGVAFDAPQHFDADYRAAAVTLARLCAQALERARLLESERQARASAELANRAKSEFLAVMSHELRTPLNAIGGYAELIELGIRGPVTEDQRKDLQRIQKSQRHLLGLLNGVLNYSRVEAGAATYEIEDVVLDEVLASAEALVAPQVRNKRLSLTYAPTEQGLVVRADGEKLQQIVLNLLTNAVKFTEPGGHIELSCRAAGDEVHVRVSDTGRGIAADQLARVFEPFVQIDARLTRTQEGVGLGLAISRDLARGMGGDLTAESTPGQGSTFTLALPLPR
ncbi:MAG: ATP-binding protein [bacterium]